MALQEGNPFKTLLQEFVYIRTYSRWLDKEQRRETWEETVTRYCTHMKMKYEDKITDKEYKDVFNAIYNLEVMPSMRALWSAGKAAEEENLAQYNCSFIAIERLKDFSEILYILMCGTGVGYSVERKYVNKLPVIKDRRETDEVTQIVFEDSKMGWARGFSEVIDCLWEGQPFECDYSKIRPRGARLKTFGGRASGNQPLMDLVKFVTDIVERNRGFQIRSIDAHDICCKIAEVVVVGGVRRCLPYWSTIFTKNGIKKIADITTDDEVEVGGVVYPVKGKVFSGKQKTLKIFHDFGVLECTPNHKVAVFEDTSTKFIFKQAQDIKPDDRLVWDNSGYTGQDTALPENTEKFHFNSTKFVIPELTNDIAWLIGYIHGNGHIASRCLEITAATQHRNVLEYAESIFHKFKLTGKISKGNGDCLRLRVNSAQLCRWFEKNIKKANTDIVIPSFILNAKKDIRRAYLAGLFDADGRSRSDGICEQATTIYESFSKQIVSTLAGLGIATSVYFGSAEKRREEGVDAKDFYSVYVRGITNRKRWLTEIAPFTVSGKMTRIGYEGSPADFKYKASMLNFPAGWKSDGNVTVAAAISHDLIEDHKYYPVPVKSIEEGELVDTYDIEVENIEMFTTDGIVVHNSACISLSDLTDNEMSNAKSGEFWHTDPQRSLSNNSVSYTRKPDIISFIDEWKNLYRSKSGERGIFSRIAAIKKAGENGRRDGSKIIGTNPCGEILLRSRQLCNLTEVVVRPEDTFESLKKKIQIATLMGTWQAGFTKFKFLDKAWKINCEEEALLGVSLTGLRDHMILGNVNDRAKKWLSDLKHVAIATNKKVAERIGINQATAITCIKPSGTVSLLVDSSPGAHVRPTNTGYYIRRIRISATDPLFKLMKDAGFKAKCEVGQTPETCSTWVLEFPSKSPEGSHMMKEETAMEQLEYWKMLRSFYCEHNPSITITIDEEDWLNTAAWVYSNFDDVGGLTFLPSTDHVYQLAPFEDIDEKTYNAVFPLVPEIDFSILTTYEKEDSTTGNKELACTGDSCTLQ